MAKVLIDVNVFSESWFKTVLSEIASKSSVRFLYPECDKYITELERCPKYMRKLLELLKILKDKKRVIKLDKAACEREMNFLEEQACWRCCEACDDSHIFAVSALRQDFFLFSQDIRLTQCKKLIINKIDNKYTRFTVIKNDKIYRRHRQEIFSCS